MLNTNTKYFGLLARGQMEGIEIEIERPDGRDGFYEIKMQSCRLNGNIGRQGNNFFACLIFKKKLGLEKNMDLNCTC